MSSEAKKFDIIIVGGGSIGLTMAASLVKFGSDLKIAILDKAEFVAPADSRSSALAFGVTRIFETLGIWEEMLKTSNPIDKMKITDSGKNDISRPVFLNFEGEITPNNPFAFMVPNNTTMKALLKLVKGKVSFFSKAEIKTFESDNFSAKLILKSGELLQAPLIIGADGAKSMMRQIANISTIGHEYGQSGVVTTISHEKPHFNTAYEHFRPNGPFASLPLPNNRSSLVWSEKTAQAEILRDMKHSELEGKIEEVMGHVLGRVKIEEKVMAFPLRLQVAKQFFAPRLALIGDAAHVMHPITGQGMNFGLKDVAALSEILIEAMRLGRDIGASDVLEDYQNWRRYDVAMMGFATESLNRLFSNDIAPIRAIRDVGLGMVEKMPFVKDQLISHAAAISNKEPRLLRGLPI